jgi:hypothetical protein
MRAGLPAQSRSSPQSSPVFKQPELPFLGSARCHICTRVGAGNTKEAP